jgi:hypothetical protein
MFAILAAILFGVALLLDVIDTAGDLVSTLSLAGLLCLALYFVFGSGVPWRRQ